MTSNVLRQSFQFSQPEFALFEACLPPHCKEVAGGIWNCTQHSMNICGAPLGSSSSTWHEVGHGRSKRVRWMLRGYTCSPFGSVLVNEFCNCFRQSRPGRRRLVGFLRKQRVRDNLCHVPVIFCFFVCDANLLPVFEDENSEINFIDTAPVHSRPMLYGLDKK